MAAHRHKRDTNARRTPKAHLIAGPLAVLATISTVGVGVLAAGPETRDLLAANASSSIGRSAAADEVTADTADTADAAARQRLVSRSGSRIERMTKVEEMMTDEATDQAIRQADTRLWTTAALDLWTAPDETGQKVGLLKEDKKILVTGRAASDRTEVVIDGESRWVTTGYLTDTKPDPDPEDIAIGGECTNGSSVSGGANVLEVHEAVCAAFPEITSYGTYRAGGGDHATGHAIDVMVSGSRGWEVAEFVRAHYSELGVKYIIYSQKIWSVERSSEGWRAMSDRGSVTANHYDHVHVSTF